MIRGAGTAKMLALSTAIIVHAALALALSDRDAIEIDGADGGTEVRLGNSFADMSAGVLDAEGPEAAEAAAPATPDLIEAEQTADTVQMAEAVPPEQIAAQHAAEAVPQARPERAYPAARAESAPALDAIPERAQPQAPETLTAVTPERLTEPEPLVQENAAATPLSPAASPQRLEGAPPDSTAVSSSLRPKRRSPEFEDAHKPPPVARAAPRRQNAPETVERADPAPGNAQRNARAGEATGRDEATAQQSGNRGRQQAAGNAAASNYPGLVMRKLSRAGRPRVNARGAAVVAFSISSDGGLSAISLARSSGSSALDQAALRLVRGAGPFPQPPQGARRDFSIQIQGR